ncbi:hypothetical protein DFH28DRAFT_947505 [Melampsora americana]|nr:hypothetical protein DFH28DRAFT_947505 [Melampsora americana]
MSNFLLLFFILMFRSQSKTHSPPLDLVRQIEVRAKARVRILTTNVMYPHLIGNDLTKALKLDESLHPISFSLTKLSIPSSLARRRKLNKFHGIN